MIELHPGRVPDEVALLELYTCVGWTSYTRDPAALHRAVCGSTFVLSAWEGSRLVGLCRALSDGEVICYVQDVLVHPDRHRRGIGRRLLNACLEAHDVRQVVLMTDPRPEQAAFYRAMGLTDLDDLPLRVFVRLGEGPSP